MQSNENLLTFIRRRATKVFFIEYSIWKLHMICCRTNITLFSKVLHKINNQLKIIFEKKLKKELRPKQQGLSLYNIFYCIVTRFGISEEGKNQSSPLQENTILEVYFNTSIIILYPDNLNPFTCKRKYAKS